MGILKRLFGGGGAERHEPVEYNGYRIRPAPFAAEGQYQTAGIIEKDFPDGAREHHFIRAERHMSVEEAVSFAVTKGKQIVDEQGDRVFDVD
jgi:hypothetical protein